MLCLVFVYSVSVVLYYNKTKGGVDCVDERVGTYSTIQSTTVGDDTSHFGAISLMSCCNASLLCTSVLPNYNTKKSYKIRPIYDDLAAALVEDYKLSRNRLKELSLATANPSSN